MIYSSIRELDSLDVEDVLQLDGLGCLPDQLPLFAHPFDSLSVENGQLAGSHGESFCCVVVSIRQII